MLMTRKDDTSGYPNAEVALGLALDMAWSRLHDLAADPIAFHNLIDQAFASAGTGHAAFQAAIEELRLQLAQGGDLGIVFDLRSAAELGGGRAAFSSDGGPRIYVNREWLAGATAEDAVRVLTEEIGHAIDQRLNGTLDSQGDEGELFANLVNGTALTDEQHAAMLAEDDHGTILIDGKEVGVEFSIDAGSVIGAAGGYLNASEVAGGMVISGISKAAGNGTSYLVAVYTSISSNTPIFWQKSAASVLTTDSATSTLTISSANLNNYQGPIYIRIYQGTSSGAGNSGPITGSTVAFPASSSFSVNSNSLSTTALTSANALSASGQRVLGTYTVDTVVAAPGAPDLSAVSDAGSSSTDNVTNVTAPVITGSGAESGATVTLYDTGGVTVLGTATANASGVWSVTSSTLTAGAHTLTAKQTDKSGNASGASTSLVVTIDTTAPASAPSTPDLTSGSDTGSSSTDNLTNDTTATVTGTGASAGATVFLYDTGGSTVIGSGVADGAGAWSITSSALSDGAHTLTAKQADTAGNLSPASSGLTITIDTTAAAPGAPDLASGSDSGSSSTDDITNDTTPTVSGTGADAGATVTLYDTNGTTVLGTATANGSGAWTITSSTLTAGAHTLTAKQTDAAGNVSAASAPLVVTIDTSASAPTALDLASGSDSGTSSTDNLTNVTTPVVNGGGADAGATVTLYDTGGVTVLGTATADGSGAWSITTSTLTSGAHTLTAKQTDAAGNVSVASASLVVTIDTTPPAGAPSVPNLSSTSDSGTSATDDVTNDTTPTVFGTGATAGATVYLYDTGGVTLLGSGVANGSGGWTITGTVLADGAHTLMVRESDAAGNVGPASSALVVTIDTFAAAPSAPNLSSGSDSGSSNTDDITSAATPVFTGTGADAGALITVYDTDGTTVLGTAIADGAGAWSITSSTLSVGVHTVTAKQTDLAGNVSAASTGLSVTIDTSATALSAPDLYVGSDNGESGTDNITNATTPTVSGSGAEAGATVTLYDTDGTTVLGTAVADGAGDWTILSSTLSDGGHTLTAKQTDVAGNVSSASGTLSITIDTVAPGTPSTPDLLASSDTGPSDTDNVTSDWTPTFVGTGDAGATITLYDTDGITVLGTGVADGAGAWSVTTTLLSDGVHTVSARQTDVAGNQGASSSGLSIYIDPRGEAPDLATASDTGPSSTDNVTKDETPTITGSGLTAGLEVTLYDTDGSTVLGNATVDGSGNWSVTTTTLSNGNHTLGWKIPDGKLSHGLDLTIDTAAVAPDAPDLATTSDLGVSDSDNITNIATPTFTGKGAETGATVTLYDTDGTTVLGTAQADSLGNWSITSSTLSAGPHTLKTKQTDLAGNVSTAKTGLVVTVDTTAPGAPGTPDLYSTTDTGVSTTDNITNKTTPVFTGSGAEAGATVTIYDTGGTRVLGTGVATAGGTWSITSLALSHGAHTITAKQTDKAGNVSVVSSGLNITVDTVGPDAPTAPDLSSPSDSGGSFTDNVTNKTTPVIKGTGAEVGATMTLYDGATIVGTGTANASGDWNITTTTLANGAHTLTVKQTDKAGNASTPSTGLTITVDDVAAAPVTPDLASTSDVGISTTDNITNIVAPMVTGTGVEAGATIKVYDTDGTTVVATTTVDSAGAWQVVTSNLSAGAHTLTAKQTDKAGNVSVASGGLAITIDTTAPGATSAPTLAAASDSGSSNSDRLTNDTTPTVSGTGAEDGATVTLYGNDRLTVLGSTIADSSGAWSITSTALGTGAHSLVVRQTDKAGNIGTFSSAMVVTVDTASVTPPAPDLIVTSDTGSSATDNLINTTTPTVSGNNGEAGATIILYDTDKSTALGTAVVDAAGTWAITTSTLSAGAHTLTTKQTDVAGNVSGSSGALVLTVDTTAPAAPSVPDLSTSSDTGTSTSDDVTNKTTPTFTGTGAESTATVTLYDTDGVTVLGTTVADGGGKWSITSSTLSAGTHSITAKHTDRAGNTSVATSALSVTVDTTAAAPSAPDLASGSDSGVSDVDNVTSDTTPTVSGNGAEAGVTVTLYDTNGSTVLGTAVADGSGAWSITSSALAAGPHTLTAKQTDKAGNVSVASASLSVTIDAAVSAPIVSDLVSASDTGVSTSDNLTGDLTPTVTGVGAEAGATVTLYDTDGTTALGSTTVDVAGNWAITTSTLSASAHTLTAKQTDRAGNVSAASSGLVITIDAVASTLPPADLDTSSDTGSSSTDGITSDATPLITGTGATPGQTVTLYDTNNVTVLGTATADGSGAWSITSSTLSAGFHALMARQGSVVVSSDLVVYVDTSATTLVTPDLVAGSDTGPSATDNATSDTTPTISGANAEIGATVTLYDTNGTTVLGTDVVDSSGTWSIDSSPLADGVHTLTVKQTDVAGNVSAASAGLALTVDTAAAAPPTPTLASGSDTGVSASDNITLKTMPTVTGSGAENGATVTLFDTNGTTVLGTAVANASGVWSITSALLAQGAHSLTAVQTDKAGNVSVASTALAITVDSGLPAALVAPDLAAGSDSGVSDTDNLTSATTPTVSGSGAEANAIVTLYDTNGTTVLGSTTASGAGIWSITSSVLTSGAHTLTVKQTDTAGNVSAVSPGMVVTVDTTAAATGTPDLVSTSDKGSSNSDNLTSRNTPTITGVGAEVGATVTLYDTDGTTVLGTTTADSAGVWSITATALSAGAHTLTTKQVDRAGNVSAASTALVVTIDTTAAAPSAPDLTVVSDTGTSSTDNLTKLATPTFSGTGAEAGATVTLYDTNGTSVLGSGVADGSGAWSVTTVSLSNGVHRVVARQTDTAGNVSAASSGLLVTIDATAAALSSPDLVASSDSGLSSTDNLTSKATPTVGGNKGEAGASVSVYDTDGTTVLGTTTVDAAGNWSVATSTLTDGAHTLTAKQTDTAGNVSAVSPGIAITIDTTAPTAPGAPDLAAAHDTGASNTDDLTKNPALLLNGSGAEAGAVVSVLDTVGSLVVGTATADASGNWSLTTIALANGVHSLTVQQTDKAGNVSAASSALSVTVDATAGATLAMPDLDAASDTGTSSTDNITKDSTPTISGTGAEAGMTVTISDLHNLVTTVLGTVTVDLAGAWSYTPTSLSDGVHVLSVIQTDTAGNVSKVSSGLSVTVDTVAATPQITRVTTTSITGISADGLPVTLYDQGFEIGTGVITSGTNWVAPVVLSPGTHVLSGLTSDVAGNVSAATADLTVVIGDTGDNTIVGTNGADVMVGGTGDDTYTVNNAGDVVTEESSGGTDTIVASVGYTIPNGSAVEFLYADDPGSLGLALTGNAVANTIYGDAGNDTLAGGGSADTLSGGDGADTFLYNAQSDSTTAGTDDIIDFSDVAGDLIDLHLLDANLSLASDQAFSFIGTGSFTGVAGQLRYAASGADTLIQGDMNGDLTADISIRLTGSHTLTAAQFVL